NQGDGIVVQDSDNEITNNVIAYNSGVGVDILSGTGNRISQNAIFGNGGLGIDLGDDGVTQNDSAGHDGPNNCQDFPTLVSAVSSAAGGTVVRGFLDSPHNPKQTFILEFFANATADPSGYGQGETFIGSTQVTTDATGHGCFVFSGGGKLGQFISATATDPYGNTSEFAHGQGSDPGFTTDPDGNAGLTPEPQGTHGTQSLPPLDAA